MKVPLNWLNKLVEVPKDVKKLTSDLTMVGHMLDKIETKNSETILDLELRGNRADCYSILGIAREVSAIYKTKLKNIPIITVKKIKELKNINLDIQTPLVKRVGMIEIKNIKITKSPKWLSDKLIAYGLESKNNIVDLTNYVMIETGEPMHAFDLDKIGNSLEIRLAKDGEKIITFMDANITLTKDDLVWTKGNEILSVAGSIGEKYHSIVSDTKNILLEAANYDRANIRKTVYRHNLLTDAGIRHEKELDPNMVDFAISRFLYFVKKYNWGEFTPEMYDYYPKEIKPWKVHLDFAYLNNFSGLTLNFNEIKNILLNLQFEIIKKDKLGIDVLVPTHRTDVTLEEDLIEEIVRIYGYDKIPTKTLSLEIPKNITPNYIIQEDKLRQSAISVGFDENISLSFVREKYKDTNVTIINPPSPDTKYLRNSLFPNLLDSAKKIVNERGEFVQLFEIGKIYFKEKNNYIEKRKIGFIYWSKEKNSFSDFKSLILTFFNKIDIKNPDYVSEILNFNFTNSYILKLNNNQVGFGGMHDFLYYVEIDLDSILGKENKYKINLWVKFPPQIEDLTLIIPEKTYIGEIIHSIKQTNKYINDVELGDIFENSYTFRIWYQHPDKTLVDKEVEKIRNEIIMTLKQKFGITIKN